MTEGCEMETVLDLALSLLIPNRSMVVQTFGGSSSKRRELVLVVKAIVKLRFTTLSENSLAHGTLVNLLSKHLQTYSAKE